MAAKDLRTDERAGASGPVLAIRSKRSSRARGRGGGSPFSWTTTSTSPGRLAAPLFVPRGREATSRFDALRLLKAVERHLRCEAWRDQDVKEPMGKKLKR